MKSSKHIEISKATLIGLKAELAKKQEEVKKVTAQNENRYISAPVRKEKETILAKQNAGVTERNERDIQLDVEEIELQRKSREILEVKSRLYDKLQEGEIKTDNKSLYLVDFEQKATERCQNTVLAGCENKVSDIEIIKKSDDYSSASDSEDDWVDYVDCFGRTRRCLRTDLEHMKSKDAQVSEKLEVNKMLVNEEQPEMLSADMHREAMRQKWEEQERKLLEKGEIHYQDVLFDEARSHGVGYYNFSIDEEERRRQQAALSKLRKETVEEQAEKQRILSLRQQQLQARLKAAHKRRRERLGLPPEEENTGQEQDTTELETKKAEEADQKEESVEDMERALKRAAHVRAWDIGKDGVKVQNTEVMTQEEWVEKKRDERPSEFAPPSSYITDCEPTVSFKEQKKTLFFTSKKKRSGQEFGKSVALAHHDDNSDNDSDCGPSVSDWKKQKLISENNETEYLDDKGAASEHTQIRQELSDAISAGLNYLRQQADIKQKKKEKGFLDIM